MSRTMKLFLLVALAEMALVAAVFFVAHWGAISHLSALEGLRRRRLIGILFGLIFAPAGLALGSLVGARQLTQRGIQLVAEHHRLFEASLAVAAVFIAVIQAWLAFGLPAGLVAPQGFVARLTLVFCGVFAVVSGNFTAKIAPPSGPLAPTPAVWIRGVLRNGWAMVWLGLFEVAAAIALPVKQLPLLLWIMLAATLLIARAQLRLVWPSSKLGTHA
jgi:hypothetical protein